MIVIRNKNYSDKEEDNKAMKYTGPGIASAGIITSLSTIPVINKYKDLANKKFESKFEKDYFDPNSIGRKKTYDKLKNKGTDLISTRFHLSNENMLNPGAGHIENWKKVAEESWGDQLWEKDNGKRINKDLLTEDNLFDAKNDLDSNFSKEKWAEYKELNDKVLKDKTDFIIKEGSKEELENFRLNKIKNLKRLKNLRRVRNIGLGIAGTGLAISAGNELYKKMSK